MWILASPLGCTLVLRLAVVEDHVSGASCRCIIKVYRRDPLTRGITEISEIRAGSLGQEGTSGMALQSMGVVVLACFAKGSDGMILTL